MSGTVKLAKMMAGQGGGRLGVGAAVPCRENGQNVRIKLPSKSLHLCLWITVAVSLGLRSFFLQWAVVNEEIHNSLKCRRKVRKNARARGKNEVSSGNNLVMALLSSQRLGLPCKIFIRFCFYFLSSWEKIFLCSPDWLQAGLHACHGGGRHSWKSVPSWGS